MDNKYKLLAARTEDLFSLCEKYCAPVFSDFLDGAEQAEVHDNVMFPYGYNTMWFGGFADAEKRMLGVFPEWTEPDAAAFPMVCMRVEGGFSRPLTHRDYLGTIMSLGIAPAKLGDIVVGDGYAHVFVHSDIAEYVGENLHKIGNQGVTVTTESDLAAVKVERRYKTIGAVCASGRLDAVVGAAARLSRSEAAALIAGGKVKLNHRETSKASEPIKAGDLLSIRGSGRFLVAGFGGETRAGRVHITLKQYI